MQTSQGNELRLAVETDCCLVHLGDFLAGFLEELRMPQCLLPFFHPGHASFHVEVETDVDHQSCFCFEHLLHLAKELGFGIGSFPVPEASEGISELFDDLKCGLKLLGHLAC